VRALERLGDEVVRALLHRVDRGLDRPVGRHQHDLGLGRERLARAQQIHAGGLRHHQIGEQDVDAVLAQQIEAGVAVGRREHGDALAPEDLGQRFDDRGLIVHDEDDPRVGGRAVELARLVGRRPGRAAVDLCRGEPAKGALRGLVPHARSGH
jgi:hypothetical protein